MSEWIFPSSVGAPLEPNRVREAFFLALKHAGMRRIRFHNMRQSFASRLIGNGESLAYLEEPLGHHSIQITVDMYGHRIPGANRKAVNVHDDPGWDMDTGTHPETFILRAISKCEVGLHNIIAIIGCLVQRVRRSLPSPDFGWDEMHSQLASHGMGVLLQTWPAWGNASRQRGPSPTG